MEDLWEKIKKSVVEGASFAAEKTEELTKLGKAKIEILSLKRKISNNFTDLGGITYEAIKTNTVEKELGSEKIETLISSLKKLEAELETKEKLYEEMTKKEKKQK